MKYHKFHAGFWTILRHLSPNLTHSPQKMPPSRSNGCEHFHRQQNRALSVIIILYSHLSIGNVIYYLRFWTILGHSCRVVHAAPQIMPSLPTFAIEALCIMFSSWDSRAKRNHSSLLAPFDEKCHILHRILNHLGPLLSCSARSPPKHALFAVHSPSMLSGTLG